MAEWSLIGEGMTRLSALDSIEALSSMADPALLWSETQEPMSFSITKRPSRTPKPYILRETDKNLEQNRAKRKRAN